MNFKLEFSTKQFIEGCLVSSEPLIVEIKTVENIYDISKITDNIYSLIYKGKSFLVTFERENDEYRLNIEGKLIHTTIRSELEALLNKSTFTKSYKQNFGIIHAEIPGLISKIYVTVGENLKKGDHLCILEAMKMENELITPIDGRIEKIYKKEGDVVEKGDLIMEIQSND